MGCEKIDSAHVHICTCIVHANSRMQTHGESKGSDGDEKVGKKGEREEGVGGGGEEGREGKEGVDREVIFSPLLRSDT